MTDGVSATEMVPPRHTEFVSSDPAEVREAISRGFGSQLQFAPVGGDGWRAVITMTDAGSFTSSDVTLPANLAFTNDGESEWQFINMLAEGHVEYERNNRSMRYGPGDVVLGSGPGVSSSVRSYHVRSSVIAIPQSLLATVAATGPDYSGKTLKFTSFEPLPDGAARWSATVLFVDSLLANHAAAASPLVIGQSARLLAATTLALFPNTASIRTRPADGRDAHPETLRRAVTFIDEHAQEDIGLADIAGAAFVTVRAVQQSFRRHLDTTPLEYLRRVRLEHAHRDLRNGTPATETVIAVSYRWGFPSPSRFGVHYRRVYGVSPVDTLRA